MVQATMPRDGSGDFADVVIARSNRLRGCEATVTFDRRASCALARAGRASRAEGFVAL